MQEPPDVPTDMKRMVTARPPTLGGHSIVAHACGSKGGWECTLCRVTSTSWKRFAPARCGGSAAVKWADRAIEAAERGEVAGTAHRRMISGDVIWCRTCGCYADTRAKGLADACKGKPVDTSGGGRAGQLNYLRTGRHPKTRELMMPAIDEDGWCYAYQRGVVVDRARLGGRASAKGAHPGTRPDATSSTYTGGTSAAEKMRSRLERIRAKQATARAEAKSSSVLDRSLRRLRGKQRPGSGWADAVMGESSCSEPPVFVLNILGPTLPDKRWDSLKPRCTDVACCRFGCDGVHGLDGQ